MSESDMASNLVEPVKNSESNPPRTPRVLLAAVIIMGVMIVLGTVLLVGIIIHRMASGHEVPPSPVQAVAPAPGLAGPARLDVPRRAGEQVSSVTARADGALAVTLRDGQGDVRILLWQPEQARLLAELTLAAPAPR